MAARCGRTHSTIILRKGILNESTDEFSFLSDHQGWELLVLSRLKWDLAAITPNDFVNPLIRRLSGWAKGKEVIIKRHTQTFIALCAAGESMMKGKGERDTG